MTSTMTSDFPPHNYMLTVLSERVKECLMENVSAEDIMDTIRSAAREHIRTSQESVKNSERLVKLVGERGTRGNEPPTVHQGFEEKDPSLYFI